jgi:hypothetical protein
MSAPKIIECNIIRRTTYMDRDVARPKLYAFSEILMVDEHGRQYCSRTWDEIKNDDFSRAHQIAEFKKRWEAAERAA